MAGALKALSTLAKRPGRHPRLPTGEVRAIRGTDPDALADYNRVCGFAVRDRLPATWLHVQGFGLQLTLLTRSDFPFPAVGLVHLANEITQVAPLTVADRPELIARLENLRGHRRGWLVDVVVEAQVGGELVWRGVSSYLAKGPGSARADSGPGTPATPGSGAAGDPPAGAARPDPSRLVPTARWAIPRDLGRRYAAVSGDHNPIHTHPLAARAFGFPGPIAHGMWGQARLLAALENRLPDAVTAKISFAKPMLLGRAVAVTWTAQDQGWDYAVWSGSAVHAWGSVSPGLTAPTSP